MSRLIVSLSVFAVLSFQCRAGVVERLDSLFADRYEDAGPAPGGAVVVMAADSIIYERYSGLADMTSARPVGPETRFNIASVSKQFTVVGLLQLVAQGKVDIDAPMSRWYPEYPQEFWHRVTPVHLASQSSGIPDSRDRSDREAIIHADDSSSVAYFPTVDSLKFAPGSAYDYVNPTFLLLAGIIERVTGESFVDYQRKHVFEPAGMGDTYYFDPAVIPEHQSHAYAPDADSPDRWTEFDYGEETFFATRPDGGIYSTARDMARWQSALRHGTLLPDKLLKRAHSPLVDVASSRWCDYQRRPYIYYGLGWFIEARPDRPFKVFHTGDNGGYQAYVAAYPGQDVSIVVLENRHDKSRREMSETIERILIEEGIMNTDHMNAL